jgi:hypothetical protein
VWVLCNPYVCEVQIEVYAALLNIVIKIKIDIRSAWKVLKCGAGEGWRRSFGPSM